MFNFQSFSNEQATSRRVSSDTKLISPGKILCKDPYENFWCDLEYIILNIDISSIINVGEHSTWFVFCGTQSITAHVSFVTFIKFALYFTLIIIEGVTNVYHVNRKPPPPLDIFLAAKMLLYRSLCMCLCHRRFLKVF